MASVFDLAVAAVQLSGVDALVRAMRAVDARGGRFLGARCCDCCEETRWPCEPAARFEPRPVIHPTPRYEPRPVIHPRPRFEPGEPRKCCPEPRPIVIKPAAELPLQPPWKTVPWKNPPQPAQVIKVACYHPDTNRKGTLIDSFI
ncbi:MAG TPA: hypothetical protein VK797_15580 [Tepidisphaeraceae bacterium]|nr:hypothetical protein [Tepidisphaeraceae bacterium]